MRRELEIWLALRCTLIVPRDRWAIVIIPFSRRTLSLQASKVCGILSRMEFEWDDEKAAINLADHTVSFDEAKTVFDDPLYVDFYDPRSLPMMNSAT